LIEQPEGALDGLIAELRRNRGDPRLTPEDFAGWSRSARFDPLLYMLTRAGRTRDWASGIELSSFVLGKLNRLELHRTFPKALLYRHRHSRSEVNALANFTFLTQDTNLVVSDRAPADYLQEFAAKRPGAIESHWIPGDPRLWQVENYPGFLAARRELLAKAANGFLDGLLVFACGVAARGGRVSDRCVIPPRPAPGSSCASAAGPCGSPRAGARRCERSPRAGRRCSTAGS
jgi:hypothetical protein